MSSIHEKYSSWNSLYCHHYMISVSFFQSNSLFTAGVYFPQTLHILRIISTCEYSQRNIDSEKMDRGKRKKNFMDAILDLSTVIQTDIDTECADANQLKFPFPRHNNNDMKNGRYGLCVSYVLIRELRDER